MFGLIHRGLAKTFWHVADPREDAIQPVNFEEACGPALQPGKPNIATGAEQLSSEQDQPGERGRAGIADAAQIEEDDLPAAGDGQLR